MDMTGILRFRTAAFAWLEWTPENSIVTHIRKTTYEERRKKGGGGEDGQWINQQEWEKIG